MTTIHRSDLTPEQDAAFSSLIRIIARQAVRDHLAQLKQQIQKDSQPRSNHPVQTRPNHP